MHKHDFDRLFNQLDALTVGFGPMFRDFHLDSGGYPPHNIIKQADNMFILELAVAGFKKNQLNIEALDNVLTVTGKRSDDVDKDLDNSYQHRGIGNRAFEKKFKLAEYIEVVDVKLADGLLSITLIRNEPESAKPKIFAIK